MSLLSERPSLQVARRAVASLHRDPADPRRHIDWALVVVPVLITVLGLATIYSARHTLLVTVGRDPWYFVKRQGIAVAGGITAMVVVASVDYRKLRDAAALLMVAVCCLLVLVVSPLGTRTNGAQAWFKLGGSFQVQPSEFAKVVLIVTLAAYASLGRGELNTHRLGVALGLGGLPIGLVMLQPDLGTALVMVAITMGVLLVAGIRRRHVVVLTLLGALSAVVVFQSDGLAQYQRDRLIAPFGDVETASGKPSAAEYTLEQSQAAIANGGLTGQGYMQGEQTTGGFVPEAQTDFIFTVLGEEFGFAGCAVLLGLYSLLALRIWRTAKLAKDLSGTLICAGALSMLAFQVFENVGMTMGIMPITGIPLPLMSYGGSAVLSFYTLIGLVQNVHMRRFS